MNSCEKGRRYGQASDGRRGGAGPLPSGGFKRQAYSILLELLSFLNKRLHLPNAFWARLIGTAIARYRGTQTSRPTTQRSRGAKETTSQEQPVSRGSE